MKEFGSKLFWENIETLREDAGVTQAELSRIVGKSPSYLFASVKNSGVPFLDTAFKLADYFGVTVEELAFSSIGLERKRAKLLKQIEELDALIIAKDQKRRLAELEKAPRWAKR